MTVLVALMLAIVLVIAPSNAAAAAANGVSRAPQTFAKVFPEPCDQRICTTDDDCPGNCSKGCWKNGGNMRCEG